MKITFMNELANLCEKTGANIDLIRMGIGSDERIGKRFLFAGIGYGGSCFPKDVKALINTARQFETPLSIMNAVTNANEAQKKSIASKIKNHFDNNLQGRKIAVWGLAFKPDTDDVREAPALFIIDELLKAGAIVSAYDPEATANAKKILGDSITYCTDQYEALDQADALLIATEWAAFRAPQFDVMAARLKAKVIFDGRNLYDPEHMQKLGFYYNSTGRKVIHP
jgi:UDPglucose 6-dehydrogenase